MWVCEQCGRKEQDVPLCFGAEAPWRPFASDEDFQRRVDLTADQCVIDEEFFFIRGHIEIPIQDTLKLKTTVVLREVGVIE